MIKLKDVYGWQVLTFQSPTMHSIVYFYLGLLGLEMLYQWKSCSIVLWINRTVHSRFFSLILLLLVLMWMCLYSVLFCSSRVYVLDSMRWQAYIMFFFISLSYCFHWLRRHHNWDKKRICSAAILKNEFLSCCAHGCACAVQWRCREM